MKSALVQVLVSLGFILFSIWLMLCLLLYFFQPRFVYYPLAGMAAAPDQAGLAYEDVSLTSADGLTLHGWYLPHPTPRATLLFLHGNGGNISHRLDKLQILHQLGLAVFIFDYRGYGRSEGKPSEHGTYLDAEAAWQHLIRDRGIPGRDIILYGESLGGAIAARLADRLEPGALVVESAFTSLTAMARHYYPYLPAGLLAPIKYPTLEYIQGVGCPLLVIHSREDGLVPYEHARRLYEAAGVSKAFLELSGDHNSAYRNSGSRYRDGLDTFISRHFGAGG